MRAAILAIGSELLGTDRLDTNSLTLTACLERFGVELVEKRLVGDHEAAIADALSGLAATASLVLVTGGLGPTRDDCTRAGAARAFERPLAVDPALVAALRARYAHYGRTMPEVNLRQAELIAGAAPLANRRGSAPGQRFTVGPHDTDDTDDTADTADTADTDGGTTVFLFPGVPLELEAMIADYLIPWLSPRADPDHAVERRVLKVAGVPESALEERLEAAYARHGREPIAVLASPGEVRVVARAVGPPAARAAALEAITGQLRALLGDDVFTADADATLESVVGAQLRAAGATVVTAESCTGGLLAERLTRVPGASAFFPGGVVTYSNELKTALVGVSTETMIEHGAVSAPVARAMAVGIRDARGADYGIGITGIAGPGGGTEAKPVGTVHIALAGPSGVEQRLGRLLGDRDQIRWQTTQLALDLLRRRLLAAAAAPREVEVG